MAYTLAAFVFYHRSEGSRNAADGVSLQYFSSRLVAAGDLVGNPFEMIVSIEQPAAMSIFLLAPETFEEPLVGRLVSQIVGIEDCTANSPEIFHDEHLLEKEGLQVNIIPSLFYYTRYFM
jgi:hypothetical protein